MILYHGSNTGGIQILEPRLADHDRPYIYMTTSDVIAAFYLCNRVERPYYWFPYGFDKEMGVPVYHELYPSALKEVSEGVSGYIYTVDADESRVIPFKNIPTARLATQPLAVTDSKEVKDAWPLFLEFEKQGRMKIARFEDKTPRQLENWYNMIESYIREKDMIKTSDCSYAKFVREKFPHVWDRYISSCTE